MFSERYRLNRSIGGLFALLMAVGVYFAMTKTSCMATQYEYPRNKATPYGIILELLMALNDPDPGQPLQVATRGDDACETATKEGCQVLLEILQALPNIESLKSCLYDGKRIKVQTEYHKKKHLHMIHLACSTGPSWAVSLTDRPDPRTKKAAPWRVISFKPIAPK